MEDLGARTHKGPTKSTMISITQKLTGNYGLVRFLLNAFRITRVFSSEKFLCASAVGALPASGSKYEVAGLFEEIQSLFGKSDEVKNAPIFLRFSI
jgi:hypothetical protein